MTKYPEIPAKIRLDILKDLKQRNYEQIVANELQLRIGERMKIKAGDQQLSVIQNKINQLGSQRRELYDGLDVINDELLEANKNTKG